MEKNEKMMCIELDDGTCTDVLVRTLPDKLEFEINHWFLGPVRVGVQRDKARLLLAVLLELCDLKTPETFQLGT